MDLLLQLWGGAFYLCNKILFSLAQTQSPVRKRFLNIIGWIVYILGVPAWIIILVIKHNWIAASIEAGGLPSMILGLFLSLSAEKKRYKILNTAAAVSTYSFIFIGLVYSIYDYQGFNSLPQLLETGVMIGFLLGSFYLAKGKISGWLFFMLMNVSMGVLMLIQHKPVLALQQTISLCFVVYGYIKAGANIKSSNLS